MFAWEAVTPLVGVWIEINLRTGKMVNLDVTPLVGVWIEIYHSTKTSSVSPSHSPCGSVD